MNDLLQIPLAFKGNWDHLLILTYGAELPFFESALWRETSARCKNKIILADGAHYLEIMERNARNGLARYLNQRYVFDGIFCSYSAHAKLILFTNSEAGRLLVGSGNLSMQGYASGGELFTQYEYSKDNSQFLPAFIIVRELLESIINLGLIGPTAIRHIHHLFKKTPWLYYPALSDLQPVRHNLDRSFIDQLEREVGDEVVEELWVLSPFYDEKAIALEELLKRLSPKAINLLVQQGYTSVDSDALREKLERAGATWKVCTFKALNERSDAYIHAKLYLIKTSSQSICLQGSPNLSQVAMLRAGAAANIELANLLVGARDQFDDLFNELDIHSATRDMDALDLTYQRPEQSFAETEGAFLLTGGTWIEEELALYYKGQAPDLLGAELLIGEDAIPFRVMERSPGIIKLKIPQQAIELLNAGMPVAFRWSQNEETQICNPIYICNRRALDELLEISDVEVPFEDVGDLNLDDIELEELLRELENQMVIDDRSFWQIAGKKDQPQNSVDESSQVIGYDDINFDALRLHPKLKQYRQDSGSGTRTVSDRTPLQIMLNSIVAHFDKLVDVQSGIDKLDEFIEVDDELDPDASEEELDKQKEEKEKHHRSRLSRIRQILKNFIRRYLQGIQSQAFQEVAGFDVMVKNYAIFSHILWRLFAKDWIEPDYLIDSLLEMWQVFWGDHPGEGYFGKMDADKKSLAVEFLQEHKSDSLLLAALFNSAYLTRIKHWDDQRIKLRDFWRYLLEFQPFEWRPDSLEGAWFYLGNLFTYDPPNPTRIVQELEDLARYETLNTFLRSIEMALNYPENCCQFKKERVFREFLDDIVSVDCILIACPDGIATQGEAIAILQMWQEFYRLPYYRIASMDRKRLCWFDAEAGEGLYYVKPTPPVEFKEIPKKTPSPWEVSLERLNALAEELSVILLVDGKQVAERIQLNAEDYNR
jgi:hypothetical protein